MKQLLNFYAISIFILFPKIGLSQSLQYNWSMELGNNGKGSVSVKNSCTDIQNHYYSVGEINGTVDMDPSNNYYLINGNRNDDTYYHSAFFAEYDSSSNFIRAVVVSPMTCNVVFNAVAVDNIGDIYIAGTMGASANLEPNNPSAITYGYLASFSNAFLVKYDNAMNLIWLKTFPNSSYLNISELELDHQNNIIISGKFDGTIDIDPSNSVNNLVEYINTNTLLKDLFIAKFDNNGQLDWAQNIGSQFDDSFADIAIDSLNNIYAGCNFGKSTVLVDSAVFVNALGNNFGCILKYNASGQYIWDKAISNNSNSSVTLYDIDVNNAGEVFFTGKLYGTVYFQDSTIFINPLQPYPSFLAKLTNMGNCAWAYAANGFSTTTNSLSLDAQSNIYLLGKYSDTLDLDYKSGIYNISTADFSNYYIASYDSACSFRWGLGIPTIGYYLRTNTNISNSGKLWVDAYFEESADFNPGVSTNWISQENSSEFVTTYTANGSYQFAFAYEGSGSIRERVTSIEAKNDGSFIVAGNYSGAIDLDPSINNLIFSTNLDSNAYIASYSNTGALNWATRIHGGVYIKGLECDTAGNIFVGGYYNFRTFFDYTHAPTTSDSLYGDGRDIFLAKYNSMGVLQWVHTIGSSMDDMCHSIAVDKEGNVIMTGEFRTGSIDIVDFDQSPTNTVVLNSAFGLKTIYVAKYNTAGDLIFAFKVLTDNVFKITTDLDNNIIATGTILESGNFNIGGSNGVINTNGTSIGDRDNFLVKYDASGNFQWVYPIGNSNINFSHADIICDDFGNIFFAGDFMDNPNALPIDIDLGPDTMLIEGNGVLIKYTPNGALLWGINTGIKNGKYIALDENGNPSIAANFLGNVDLDPDTNVVIPQSSNQACIIVRYTSNGEYLSSVIIPTLDNDDIILPTDIAIVDSNTVIIGGFFAGNIDLDPAPGNQNLFLNISATLFWQNKINGFIASFNQNGVALQLPPSAAFASNFTNICEDVCINFQDNTWNTANTWNWSFPGANPSSSTSQHPQNICYPNVGNYDVQLIVSNSLGTDTVMMNNYIIVNSIPQTSAGNDMPICEGSTLQLFASGANAYTWSPATALTNPNDPNNPNPMINPTATTTYTLTGNNGGCFTIDDITITVNPNPLTPTISPVGGEFQSSTANAYQWYYNGSAIPGATLQNIFPSQIGNYSVTVFDATGCFASSSSYLVTVVGVEATSNGASNFVIAPNPVLDQINIYSSQSQNNLSIKLYDVSGKLIAVKNMQLSAGLNTLDFNISSLNAGVYRIEILEENTIHSYKVIKLDH